MKDKWFGWLDHSQLLFRSLIIVYFFVFLYTLISGNNHIFILVSLAILSIVSFMVLNRMETNISDATYKMAEQFHGELNQLQDQVNEFHGELNQLQDQVNEFHGELNQLQDQVSVSVTQISETLASVERNIQKEREERIAGFARRDSIGRLPKRALILLTLHRCGSTWLYNLLRCHPNILIDPAAILFKAMQLTGGRFPIGLSNGPLATLDFENMPNRGMRIPEYISSSPHIDTLPDYWLEKIHPLYFDNDSQAFIDRIVKLEAEHDIEFTLIYQVREPKSVMASFWNYQHRDSNWYSGVSQDTLPQIMAKAYNTILKTAQHRSGFILDYSELKTNPQHTLMKIYCHLWSQELAEKMSMEEFAQEAFELTSREKLRKQSPTLFLGEKEGLVGGTHNSQYDKLFEKHSDTLASINKNYQAILDLKNDFNEGI